MMPCSSWCCSKKKNNYCSQVVTKGNKHVNCRREPKHRVSIGTDNHDSIFQGLFNKYDKVNLCDFHYSDYIKEKCKFEKRFTEPQKRTKVSLDLEASHGG